MDCEDCRAKARQLRVEESQLSWAVSAPCSRKSSAAGNGKTHMYTLEHRYHWIQLGVPGVQGYHQDLWNEPSIDMSLVDSNRILF